MINSKFVFLYDGTIYLEQSSDDEARFTYLDPKSYGQMKVIAELTPGSTAYVQVFENLVVVISQNLNCLMYTKDKELTFRLSREMIGATAIERTSNGFLVICSAYRNGNPSFLSSLLNCRRQQEAPVVKIITVELVENYKEIQANAATDILTIKAAENRDAITTLNGCREVNWVKYVSNERIYLIADGIRLQQYRIDKNKLLQKVKEFDYNFDPEVTIGSLFYKQVQRLEETKQGTAQLEYITWISISGQKIYALDLNDPKDNILITEMEDKMATCIETDDGMVMIKFALDQSCKIYLERIIIPEDKERVIKQIALEGNIDLALEMANKLADPSIASNIRLRNGWEHSNRTVQDIDMLLKKIKDPEYIVQQCISNATPNKDILKGDAIEFVDVQRHLIKTGLDALMDTDNHIPNANRFVNQLLLKEERLTKYEIVLNAFKDDSENVIIDWESFSELQYMEMIEYINSICLIEETPIDKIVLSLKEIDRALFREHYLDILRTIDTSLMNDTFLVNVLPQGDRPSEGKFRSK